MQHLFCIQDKEVTVGCTVGSSTYAYFKQSHFTEYSHLLQHWTDTNGAALVNNTSQGVARARADNYAFITESLTAKYYVSIVTFVFVFKEE